MKKIMVLALSFIMVSAAGFLSPYALSASSDTDVQDEMLQDEEPGYVEDAEEADEWEYPSDMEQPEYEEEEDRAEAAE